MRAATLTILLTSCAVMTAVPAVAQDVSTTAAPQASTSNDPYADIVVTAQRRSESVQDVPIAVSVVGAEQLARQQVNGLQDLQRTTAAVQFAGNGAGGSAFIRGIGSAQLSRSAEPAVGIVVDGVVQGNTNISNLFDVSRVEVLRGPQGTLFGQSVSAGVINITTEAPDPTRVSGRIVGEFSDDGTAGSEFGRAILRGGINLPVGGDAALRVSGFGSRTTGILYNRFERDGEGFGEWGGRARFKAGLGDTVTVNLVADYNRVSGIGGSNFFTLTTVTSPATNAILANPACGVVARPGNLEYCASGLEQTDTETYGGAGTIEAELGSYTLTSITAKRWSKNLINTDIDRLPNALAPVDVQSGVDTRYRQFTQELRLASDPVEPFSFTVGGFYFRANTESFSGPAQGASTTIPNGFVLGVIERQFTTSENLSGFGEARYKGDGFTVFGGARITDAKIRYQGTRQSVTLVGPIPNGRQAVADLTFKDTDISWRVGAQYDLTPDVMAFGTISRGYKNAQVTPIFQVPGPGGVNVDVLGRIILPEKPMAYELGLKTTLFDRRLVFNVSGFYQNVRNLQAQTAVRDPVTQVPSPQPINISRVISKGIEVDMIARLGSNFTLNASAIYNIAKYPRDFLSRDNIPLVGQQIAFAPRFAANLSGEYFTPLGSGDTQLFFAADANYRSRTRLTDETISNAITSDTEHLLIGGRIGARVDNAWSVALFVSNLTKQRIGNNIASLVNQGGGGVVYGTNYSARSLRQVGVQAQFEF